MIRTIFLSLLVILNLATQHVVNGRNFCVWCNQATADSFMYCLGDKILSNRRLQGISRDNMDDMKNSMLAASSVMTRTPPNAKMKMLNRALAGEITGMIRSQVLNTGQSADAVTGEIMRMIADCYISVTGESHVNFIQDLGKTVDFMMKEDQDDYDSPDDVASNLDNQMGGDSVSAYSSYSGWPQPKSPQQSFPERNNAPFPTSNLPPATNYPSSQVNNPLVTSQINYQQSTVNSPSQAQVNYRPSPVNNPSPAEVNYQPSQVTDPSSSQVHYQPPQVNNPSPAQVNYQPPQVNNPSPSQVNYQPPQVNNPSPAQVNYQPPQVNNPSSAQINYQPPQVNNPYPAQVNYQQPQINIPFPDQVNYQPPQINNPSLQGNYQSFFTSFQESNPFLPQVNSPPSQINNPVPEQVNYSPNQFNNPFSTQINNPSPQVSNLPPSFGVDKPQPYQINQYTVESSANSVSNQPPFNNIYQTGGSPFSNQPIFSQVNQPGNAQTVSQTNVNFDQRNSQPGRSDPVGGYATNDNGNYPVVENIYHNEQSQPVNSNVAVSVSEIQTNPIQINTNTYESGRQEMTYVRPVPNYYYDYPRGYDPQLNPKTYNEPSAPAAVINVQANPMPPKQTPLEYPPLSPVMSNIYNQQTTFGNADPNLGTSNLSPQSPEVSEYKSQSINKATEVNDQYPEYTYTFNSANSNGDWGEWKSNNGDISSSADIQTPVNNPYTIDNDSPPSIAVTSLTNAESKPFEDSFSNGVVASATNNHKNEPSLEPFVVSSDFNSDSDTADSNTDDTNSKASAVATDSNLPPKPNVIQQVAGVDDPESEKSCAMRFAESLFVQISESPEFSQILGENTPKSFVAVFFPEVTKRAVMDSGFGDLSDEVAALSKEYVDQLPESSNSQTYAEKMTKSIMVPMFKIKNLDLNCEEIARSIASNILKYFRIILPYISSSVTSTNEENRATNDGNGISPSDLSNENQVKPNSPSIGKVSSNGNHYPEYSPSAVSESDYSPSDYYQYDYPYDYSTNADVYNYDQSNVKQTSNNNEENISETSGNEKSADDNEDEYCDDDIVDDDMSVAIQPANIQNDAQLPSQDNGRSSSQGSIPYQDLPFYQTSEILPFKKQYEIQNLEEPSEIQQNSNQGQKPWTIDQVQYPNYDARLSPISDPISASEQRRNPAPEQNPGSILLQALNPNSGSILNGGQSLMSDQNPGSISIQGINPSVEQIPRSVLDQEPIPNLNQEEYEKPPLESISAGLIPDSESVPISAQNQFSIPGQNPSQILHFDPAPNPVLFQGQGANLHQGTNSDKESSSYQEPNPSQVPNPTLIQNQELNPLPIQYQPYPTANQGQVELSGQEPQTKVINDQITYPGQRFDPIPSQDQDSAPIPIQNTQIPSQILQNGYKDTGNSPLGEPNEEMKEQINLLMRACLNGITDTGYKYNDLTSTMASISQNMKNTHADWSGDKILTLTYLETIVACTQVLQNLGVAKTLNPQSNENPSDSVGVVTVENSQNGGETNIFPASNFANVNPRNTAQASENYNSNFVQPQVNVEVQSGSSNQQYLGNAQFMPQSMTGDVNNNVPKQNYLPYQQGQINNGNFFQTDYTEMNNQPVANIGTETRYPSYSRFSGFYPNTYTGTGNSGDYASSFSSSVNTFANSNGFLNTNTEMNGNGGMFQTG